MFSEFPFCTVCTLRSVLLNVAFTRRWPLTVPHVHDGGVLCMVLCHIFCSRWGFKVKADRWAIPSLVAVHGWAHRHGFDCRSTFERVCRQESQVCLLAITTADSWPILAMEIQSAFPNGQLQETVKLRNLRSKYKKRTPCDAIFNSSSMYARHSKALFGL